MFNMNKSLLEKLFHYSYKINSNIQFAILLQLQLCKQINIAKK